MRVLVQVSCEQCGESHGTIDLGPQKLLEQKSAKKMAELVGGLLPMFLKQGIEHECTMNDERRAEIRKYMLSGKCPICGDRMASDPRAPTDIVCGDCTWRCTAAEFAAVRGF